MAMWCHKNEYLYLYSFCFITKGINRILLVDTCQQNVYLLPVKSLSFFELISKYTVADIYRKISVDETPYMDDFVDFVIKNELGRFVKDIALFPKIEEVWDEPCLIKKAIIDYRNIFHDFKKIFVQLSDLGCRSVEIRCYNGFSMRDIEVVSDSLSGDSIRNLVLILPYIELTKSVREKIDQIIVQSHHRMFFFFYSVPINEAEKIKLFPEYIKSNIKFNSKEIKGCSDCGVVDVDKFSVPNLQQYMEYKLYNSCLNRLISIDEMGEIKNCPSFDFSYGNINHTALVDVVKNVRYQSYWLINKDLIEGCCDCEFRIICKDCRAYICDRSNIYSKPLKCKYNPYEKENTR